MSSAQLRFWISIVLAFTIITLGVFIINQSNTELSNESKEFDFDDDSFNEFDIDLLDTIKVEEMEEYEIEDELEEYEDLEYYPHFNTNQKPLNDFKFPKEDTLQTKIIRASI